MSKIAHSNESIYDRKDKIEPVRHIFYLPRSPPLSHKPVDNLTPVMMLERHVYNGWKQLQQIKMS